MPAPVSRTWRGDGERGTPARADGRRGARAPAGERSSPAGSGGLGVRRPRRALAGQRAAPTPGLGRLRPAELGHRREPDRAGAGRCRDARAAGGAAPRVPGGGPAEPVAAPRGGPRGAGAGSRAGDPGGRVVGVRPRVVRPVRRGVQPREPRGHDALGRDGAALAGRCLVDLGWAGGGGRETTPGRGDRDRGGGRWSPGRVHRPVRDQRRGEPAQLVRSRPAADRTLAGGDRPVVRGGGAAPRGCGRGPGPIAGLGRGRNRRRAAAGGTAREHGVRASRRPRRLLEPRLAGHEHRLVRGLGAAARGAGHGPRP